MKQRDMDLDGSRYDLLLLMCGLFSTIQMMECRMMTVLEALDRSGITVQRHKVYGWQWQVGNHGGRTDTLPDAIEDALKAVQP